MSEHAFDVVIIGGAFSGAAVGVLLKRRSRSLRVLIVEKASEFDRKVGESTTEVSSCFMTKLLGLTHHLGHEHLGKQGLRMWFARDSEEAFERCAEIGAMYNSRLSGFQVDRAKLDEHVLAKAVEAGCELWRPAKVGSVDLAGEGRNLIDVSIDGETRKVRAGWIVDASGRVALLARKLGTLEMLTEHPVNTLWARFTGVADWDGADLRARFPEWANATKVARGWATNHLCGLGWWVWIIPLRGGDVSIGLVYDSRLYSPPEQGSIGERILRHCREHPVGREMFANACAVEGDQRAYSQLPYRVGKIAGDGWVCVGDAAGFLDPLYSSGLDFSSFTSAGAAAMICPKDGIRMDIECYNRRFSFCFGSWFECIYRDKYYYLGDAELMEAAFLMDIATYHLGPVTQVYSDPSTMFESFPFDGRAGRIAAKFIAFYNRRLSALARKKISAGRYGERNADSRLLVGGFTTDRGISGKLLFSGIWRWMKMEVASALWRKTSSKNTNPTRIAPTATSPR